MLWGGVLVTIVVASVGIVFSLPLGILLALGRRSSMPTVNLFSTMFIEFVRGVPLITVLFMASVMLPLFVPEQFEPDKLLRALIGIALFASAYMAEVVRAGLQAIPKGQFEGAMAVGLGYWQMMRLIVLPQALKITIPNIVNTYIGLFKDTTLVFIVGIFDFLRTIEVSRIDPKWATPVTSTTGYAVAAMFYLIFCYAMSRYARAMEARLATGRQTLEVAANERSDRRARPQADAQLNTPVAVEIVGMNKWYGEFHVLRDINLKVMGGERIVICGPSGSGKSTMIRCINRLEEHQQGRIVVDGVELTNDLKKIDEVRREVGMVFQHFNLFPHLTVLENCTLAPIWVRKMPKREAEEIAHALSHAREDPRAGRTNIPASSPAASSSASRSRARCA